MTTIEEVYKEYDGQTICLSPEAGLTEADLQDPVFHCTTEDGRTVRFVLGLDVGVDHAPDIIRFVVVSHDSFDNSSFSEDAKRIASIYRDVVYGLMEKDMGEEEATKLYDECCGFYLQGEFYQMGSLSELIEQGLKNDFKQSVFE